MGEYKGETNWTFFSSQVLQPLCRRERAYLDLFINVCKCMHSNVNVNVNECYLGIFASQYVIGMHLNKSKDASKGEYYSNK